MVSLQVLERGQEVRERTTQLDFFHTVTEVPWGRRRWCLKAVSLPRGEKAHGVAGGDASLERQQAGNAGADGAAGPGWPGRRRHYDDEVGGYEDCEKHQLGYGIHGVIHTADWP